MNSDFQDTWREELQTDDTWNGVRMETPPPLTARFRKKNPWPVAAGVAAILLTGSSLLNMQLAHQLADARTNTLIALLQQDTPLVALASIEDLRNRGLSDRAMEAIKDVVRFSEDPNAQLSALEALYELNALEEEHLVTELLSETQSNPEFIRAAIRAMNEESI
ncbi:MAG: hypothetical protein AAGI27_15110 [Pseudomonadota bacterium]